MPRPNNVKSTMGFGIVRIGPPKPIGRIDTYGYGEGWDADKYDDHGTGVFLRIVKMYPAANEVFTPEELEERLDRIRERVLAEEARINAELKRIHSQHRDEA